LYTAYLAGVFSNAQLLSRVDLDKTTCTDKELRETCIE
jgi:hypothetical protein